MKTSYIFVAILACSVVGTVVSGRAMKTAMLVSAGVLSLYGVFRMLG